MNDKIRELLKTLPKIDELLLVLEKNGAFEGVSRDIITEKCRQTVEEMRNAILDSEKGGGKVSGPFPLTGWRGRCAKGCLPFVTTVFAVW